MEADDPFYQYQWHFDLIGGIERVWEEFDGRGVKVGVFDNGVDWTHPDLADNYDGSLHYGTQDGLPKEESDNHGTPVAGIIAAQDNNDQGVVGVAHGATLTSVVWFPEAFDEEVEISNPRLAWSEKFDIVSNSWGWKDISYSADNGLIDAEGTTTIWANTLAKVSENGRGGLGTIIVQCAMNEAANGNSSGLNTSRHTITVAATDVVGFAMGYSSWGASLLLTAPAAALTTDRLGKDGYNADPDFDDPFPADYTSEMGGTSAATPVVSGVVALMLEANADLGWRDVSTILAMSSSLTGSAYGGPGSGHEIGDWTAGGTSTWNGGGSAYHQSYGYGMVDALAAVRMAEAWLIMHGQPKASANEVQITVEDTAVVDIVDGGVGEKTLTVSEDLTVETLYVTITVTHDYAEDLKIALVAPDGTEVPLFLNEGNAQGVIAKGWTWTFAVEGLRGYSAKGDWVLRAYDKEVEDVGQLGAVKLDVFGSAATNDTVHHLTEDFLTLAAVEGDRTTITDQNGGTDWINMAAITGGITGSLSAGSAIKVDGVKWVTLANDAEFENLFAGDGDDAITGSAAANQIWGGRGNDTLLGEAGDDILNGGQGDDRLDGGDGSNIFRFNEAFGKDTIDSFADTDALVFDAAIWGGGLSVAQMVAAHATATSEGVLFDFKDGSTLLLSGISDPSQLIDRITLR